MKETYVPVEARAAIWTKTDWAKEAYELYACERLCQVSVSWKKEGNDPDRKD